MTRWRWIWGVAALCAASVACSGGGGGHDDGAQITGVKLAQAFGARTFSSPVKAVQHPSFDHRWYVVEQTGLVKTFLDNTTDPATTAATVGTPTSLGSGEQGLLGMAFDPNFATSGEIYLAYTAAADNRLVLARWVRTDANGLTFALDSVILNIPHTDANHNGSDLAFGNDGFLYYSTGDGGGADDPSDNGQNRNVLLGKILRIDVNATPPAGKTYAIPGSNPFAGNPQCNAGPGAAPCPEIFAYGFRNPWRMNFDPVSHKLYVGDVGQDAQEEIDVVTNGGNFGWDCFEGEVPHGTSASCVGPFVAPEVAYDDSTSGPSAVTGGAVYRGSALPGLLHRYIYTDFYSGPFFAFDVDVANAPAQSLSITEAHIAAFAQGRDGEIYAVDHDGQVWKIVPSSG